MNWKQHLFRFFIDTESLEDTFLQPRDFLCKAFNYIWLIQHWIQPAFAPTIPPDQLLETHTELSGTSAPFSLIKRIAIEIKSFISLFNLISIGIVLHSGRNRLVTGKEGENIKVIGLLKFYYYIIRCSVRSPKFYSRTAARSPSITLH